MPICIIHSLNFNQALHKMERMVLGKSWLFPRTILFILYWAEPNNETPQGGGELSRACKQQGKAEPNNEAPQGGGELGRA